MLIKKEDLTVNHEFNNDGEKKLYLYNLAEFERKNPKLRTFALAKLLPGEKVEFHIHNEESESYYIISGKGSYNDNGDIVEVTSGTVTFTPSGQGHGIENIGDDVLEFIALIIRD